MNSKRIAVLGATGQIGKIIVKALQRKMPKENIVACSRKPKASFFHFDPFEDDWERLGNIDVLINCIGIIQAKKENTFEKVHLDLAQLILENREKIKQPKIIQISVLGANEKSKIPFLESKGKADNLLLKNSDVLVVRPSIVCTENALIIEKLKLLKNLSQFFFYRLPFPNKILQTRIQPVMAEDLGDLVFKSCFNSIQEKIIPVVGADVLCLEDLFDLMPSVKLLKVSENILAPAIKIFASFFPQLISQTQYELLTFDNVGNSQIGAAILERPLQSTLSFFKTELNKSN